MPTNMAGVSMGDLEILYPAGDRLIIKDSQLLSAGKWANCDQCDRPTYTGELTKSIDSSGETLWWLCHKCSTSK